MLSHFVQVALTVVIGALTPIAGSEIGPGIITGRVTLENGDAVHGATVIVVGARRQATTGEDGRYEIRDVPSGSHEVIAHREHFAAARQRASVVAGQTVTLDFKLSLSAHHEEVTVTTSATGAATAFESFNSVRSLDGLELAKNRGATLADALAGQAGVAVRSFGAGNARPIIRGFDGDRVLLMQDGVRTGDLSSQSGDHGVTLDPAGLDRVEVVRGPATLLFGSNAVGGVVNAISPQDAFRAQPFAGVVGAVTFDTGSTNAQGGGSANVQVGRGPWLLWAGGGGRRTGDYDTPEGVVDNSASRITSGRFGVGWTGARAFVSAGGQFEGQRFGIPFAGLFHVHEEEEEPGAPEEEHALDVDVSAQRRDLRIDGGFRNLSSAFLDALKVTINHTLYEHDELEIEDAVETLGTHFRNRTSTVRLEAEQPATGRLSGRYGVEWFGRDYSAAGEEALAPHTAQSSMAAFLYEELRRGRLRWLLGGRVERTAYEVDERPEHTDEPGEEEHEPPPVRNRTFTGASAAFGIHADLGGAAALVVNVTTSSRAPALEELYNFGPHVGNLAFEIGNPDLELERSTGIDVSLRSRAERVHGEVTFFTYAIDNFVFLDFTGEIEHNLREALFLQGDSRFIGFEASGEFDLARGLHLHAGVSAVRATLTGTDEAVPRIPPLAGRLELEIPWRSVTISPEVVVRARQSRVFRDETPTAGSAVLNLGATWLVVRGHATHAVVLKAFNLTNETYRVHTSFIKDLAPEMSRGVRVGYTVRFY
jgi:iron complex outermembrane receptor protein